MSPIWLIPGVVLLIGSAAVAALLRTAAEESRLLLAELRRQREVADAVNRLGASLRTLQGPDWPRR